MTGRDLSEDEDAVAAIVRRLRVVAVVGMQDEARSRTPAYRIPEMMRAMGVRVIPVNPAIARTQGIDAVPDLASVGEPIDAVQIFRRSEAVPPVADQVLALPPSRRPGVVWMQSGIVNEDAARRLVEAGIDVVMDRCLSVDMARYA